MPPFTKDVSYGVVKKILYFRDYAITRNPQWGISTIGSTFVLNEDGSKAIQIGNEPGRLILVYTTPHGTMTARLSSSPVGGQLEEYKDYKPGTLGYDLKHGMYPYYAGKTNLSTQWSYWRTFYRNRNCWMYGMDMSGLATGGPDHQPWTAQNHGPDLTLISPSYAVTAKHCLAYPGLTDKVTGWTCYNEARFTFDNHGIEEVERVTHFESESGEVFENFMDEIVSCPDSAKQSDLVLIHFRYPCPSYIHPFQVFTMAYHDYITTPMSSVPVMWLKNNDIHGKSDYYWGGLMVLGYGTVEGGSCSAKMVDYTFKAVPNEWYDVNELDPYMNGPFAPFGFNAAWGGDSSGPVFTILKDNPLPVFLFAVQSASISGPAITNERELEWIVKELADHGEHLNEVDLSKYPKLSELP